MPDHDPKPQSFRGEWVLPILGGFGVALTIVGVGYLIAAWWVA